MVLNPLAVLKKGLKTLHDQVKAKKEHLWAQLAKGKSIFLQDAKWLDGEANLIDKDRVLEALEKASNYEQGLERLDEGQRGFVVKLQQAAGEILKSAGKKRKRPEDKPKGSTPNKGAAVEPIYTKKENATLEQRIEIINWHNANGKNQSKTAQHFNLIYPNLKIKQPLIHLWITHQDKWQREWAEAQACGAPTIKQACQTQHPDVTKMMELWVSKAMTNGILITGETLRQKWRSFANLAGVPNNKCLTLICSYCMGL